MPRTITYLASLSLVASFAPSVLAQKDSCSHRILSVSVQDSLGRPINGLANTDFEAQVGGKPLKVLSVAPDRRRHRIVILLDASISMRQGWGNAMSPASDLAETRLPGAELAVIIFNERVIEKIDFNEGQRSVVARLRQIGSDAKYAANSVGGRTALYDALLAGLRLLGTATSADILYVVTDGEDTASNTKSDELARLLSSSGVRVYVPLVHDIRTFPGATPEDLHRVGDLSDLVNKTGGEMLSPFASGIPKTPKEIDQFGSLMYDFYRRMFDNYLLEVEFPEPLEKHRSWELKLSQKKREQWKDSRITYPTELSGCV